MSAPRPAHWLRGNRAARIPRRIVCLDSEAWTHREPAGQILDFRLAVASFDRIGADGRPTHPAIYHRSDDPLELWRWVTEQTATANRTIVFAHNLSVDARLTGALEHLPALGFELRQHALTPYSYWARFTQGRRSLALVDSTSWLPQPLHELAGLMGESYHRRPPADASAERWFERCRQDVRVLRELVLRILAFVHDDDLGDFRLTGPAQASACYRHRFLLRRTLLAHGDAAVTALERRAAWAGRCEVWQHGTIAGQVREYDFDASYCRIAAELELPVRMLGWLGPLTLERFERINRDEALLLEVELATTVPTVPAELDGRTVWPVGRFRSSLWDTELRLALEQGAEVTILGAVAYERRPVLAEWARWVLAALAGEPPGDDPIRRAILKVWSRSLIGRFGLRYPELIELGRGARHDVSLYPVRDAERGVDVMYAQMGYTLFEQGARIEGRDSMPALMGAIMAEARVRLWRAAQVCGLGEVLYLDTDGLLTTQTLEGWKLNGDGPLAGMGLRHKATFEGAELRAPRNIDVGEQRRVAGVPRKAAQLAPGRFAGEVWESLPTSLRRRRSGRVVIAERTYDVGSTDPRRRHLAGGATAPLELALAGELNVLAQP